MDDLATQIEDTNADATVSKEEDGDTVYMVIDGLTQDDIIDIFENDYNIDDVDTYFTYDDADDELDDVESDDDARAAAEADMQDEYGDYYQDMDEDYGLDDEGEWLDIPEDDDARDTAIDDMKDEYGDDYVDMDESIDDDEYLDDEDDYDDMIPDYDEVDPNDPDALDARDDAYADMDAEGELDDDLYDETYEDADEEFADEDSLNDSDDDFDECMEDEEFECYESKNDRRLKRKKLLEKKKGCCPGKKRNGKRLVNLSEVLKMRKNGLTTKDIVKSAKKTTLNESIINRAINKAKDEPVNKKVKLQQKRRELLALKESIGAEKFEFIRKAMKSGKKNLYEKKTINGKNITEYTAKELLELLNTVKAQHTKLMKSYKSLNESASKSTKRELRDSILNKEKLMNILDEELTYRLTYKKLVKAKGLKLNEDDETQDNPLEPLPVDPTGADGGDDSDADSSDDASTDTPDDSSTDENPDTDEEVELSRVVITVANQAAADELKQSLVDAGVPDDAIEFEDEEDETDDSDDTDSDSSDDNTDDTSSDDESSDDSADTDDNASNESLHYNKFKKLLEDDNDDSTDDANADDSADDSDSDSDDASADDTSDDNADGEDKPVKVVLTNTDYVNDLADVLNNEYGITKEEFEDMIGGQIVDDDSDSTDDNDSSDDDSSDSDSDDKSDDEKKDDEPSTNGDDAVDAMSQEELDKLFGGN